MRNRCGPSFEALEARQFLSSTTAYLTNQCLPPPPVPPVFSPIPKPPPVVSQPAPTPVPPIEAPSKPPKSPRGNGGTTTPGALAPSALVGLWGGGYLTASGDEGSITLSISSGRNGELYGSFQSEGPITVSSIARLNYNAKTGRFSFLQFSPRAVLRFDGTVTLDSDRFPQLSGTLQYYTKHGMIKSTFTLSKQLGNAP